MISQDEVLIPRNEKTTTIFILLLRNLGVITDENRLYQDFHEPRKTMNNIRCGDFNKKYLIQLLLTIQSNNYVQDH